MNGHGRPQREHTEIEEELHEVAHIDYDRVSIVGALTVESIALLTTYRSPTRPSLHCTKMLWSTRLELPSHQQEH